MKLRPGITLASLILYLCLVGATSLSPTGLSLINEDKNGSVKGYVYDLAAARGAVNLILTINDATAVTDKNGYFEFNEVKTGQHYLDLDKSGIPTDKIPVQRTPILLNVREGRESWIELDLVRAASLSGTIQLYRFVNDNSRFRTGMTGDSLKKKYQNAGGGTPRDVAPPDVSQSLVAARGLGGTVVELTNSYDTWRRVSDPRGHFEFTAVPPSQWTLSIHDDNLPKDRYLESKSIELELSPGEARAVLVRVLPRRPTIQTQEERLAEAVGKTVDMTATKEDSDQRLPATAESEAFQNYTVQSGDWLSKIAFRYFGDPMKHTEIFDANRDIVKNPDLIYPGQQLRIPRASIEESHYTVQRGDWLSKIALRLYGYATKYTEIFQANRHQVADPDLIYPRQVLTIPSISHETIYHTVEVGDWLSAIAKRYYGDSGKYAEIFGANLNFLEDQDQIKPGQRLLIPKWAPR